MGGGTEISYLFVALDTNQFNICTDSSLLNPKPPIFIETKLI